MKSITDTLILSPVAGTVEPVRPAAGTTAAGSKRCAQRHTGVEVAIISIVAGGEDRLATLAVHIPCGIPSRTTQRIFPWLGRHHFASRVLPSTVAVKRSPASNHTSMSVVRDATTTTVS